MEELEALLKSKDLNVIVSARDFNGNSATLYFDNAADVWVVRYLGHVSTFNFLCDAVSSFGSYAKSFEGVKA